MTGRRRVRLSGRLAPSSTLCGGSGRWRRNASDAGARGRDRRHRKIDRFERRRRRDGRQPRPAGLRRRRRIDFLRRRVFLRRRRLRGRTVRHFEHAVDEQSRRGVARRKETDDDSLGIRGEVHRLVALRTDRPAIDERPVAQRQRNEAVRTFQSKHSRRHRFAPAVRQRTRSSAENRGRWKPANPPSRKERIPAKVIHSVRCRTLSSKVEIGVPPTTGVDFWLHPFRLPPCRTEWAVPGSG